MRDTRGFSLIELAVVLVVVGLLMGAIIQGQKIWYNARMQRIVSDMQNYTQAFLLYYDRYGMYPGDENDSKYLPRKTKIRFFYYYCRGGFY